MTRPGLRVVLALTALVVAGCLGKTTDSSAPLDILSPGQWVPLAPMPTARQEVAVAELNGRVFVIGGFGPDNPPRRTMRRRRSSKAGSSSSAATAAGA